MHTTILFSLSFLSPPKSTLSPMEFALCIPDYESASDINNDILGGTSGLWRKV